MKINFKKLETRQDWEEALASIVALAQKAVRSRDEENMAEANGLLNAFIDASPPAKEWSTDLDDHARDALGQLAVDIATATNDDLASRTEELRRVAKAIQATAADNDQKAADIRHEKLTRALTAALDAGKAVKDLQAAVADSAADGNLANAAEKLLQAISNFKDVIASPDSSRA
jgi:hypothetical protein